MTDILVALITGGMALVGVIISNISSANKTNRRIEQSQGITEYKIDQLTREVREHNNFARRMPVVEEQIKVINNRIKDLENKG